MKTNLFNQRSPNISKRGEYSNNRREKEKTRDKINRIKNRVIKNKVKNKIAHVLGLKKSTLEVYITKGKIEEYGWLIDPIIEKGIHEQKELIDNAIK